MCLSGRGRRVLHIPANRPRIGYRAFYVGTSPIVWPTFSSDNPWSPELAPEANCAPTLRNEYGLYCYKSFHSLERYFSHAPVAAEIEIWGKTVEHSDGYRASYARIRHFYVRLCSHWYNLQAWDKAITLAFALHGSYKLDVQPFLCRTVLPEQFGYPGEFTEDDIPYIGE